MSFVKYQNTNNASSLLIADITASQTTILITDWDQSLFPSSFPFLLTIEHLDASENVILREIVKVVSSNQNSFTVERSAWICVQDDTATNRVQDNTAHAFYSWDKISLYWTAEQVQDIQNNLELKANQEAIANLYDNTATYSVWDIVVYGWDRYVCSTAVETPEEFDSTKWTKVNVQYDMDQQDLRIDNIETQIAWLWAPNKVDVLVLGWWWGWGWWVCWWSSFAYGWWWWAWELKIVDWLVVRRNSITITVWAWWQGWAVWYQTSWAWWNWCPSKFWILTAMWWGWWGWAMCWNFAKCYIQWKDWANGWGSWWTRYAAWINDTFWNPSVHTWHFWTWRWSSNWNAYIAWWGWGWIWWNWWLFWMWNWQCTCIIVNFFWWPWAITSFWWTNRWIWGWWAWWSCWNAYNMYAYVDLPMELVQRLCFTCFWWWAWWACWACNWCNWTANTWWWWGWGWAWTNLWWTWGNGWSWLVIVRYPTDCSYWIKTATWGTITTATISWIEYKVHTFTSWGTFCITESV